MFREFNTLSVMYGVPSNTFIIQECPYTREQVPNAADRKDGMLFICVCEINYLTV